MENMAVWFVLTGETLFAGLLILLIPRVTRRGLLFGVYVGESAWAGDEARRITRTWYHSMIAALAGAVTLGTVLSFAGPGRPLGAMTSLIVLLGAFVVSYLRAHFRARRLATDVPVAAAALVVETRQSLAIPIAATIIAAAGGLVAVAYAWMHYGERPAMIPTHFGPSGAPDAWSPRSFGSVMLLPLMTLFMCPAIGLMACFVARAKRAIRQADHGVSLDAQLRFRRAVALFLSGIVVLTSLMLTTMSVNSVRVALGRAAGLPRVTLIYAVVMVVFSIGGALYLMLHYGQGGARLERAASSSPLTGGVADNTRWVLGMFYVNRDDPSLIVEKRFGVGYTLNFGNWKAILLIAVFFAVLIGVMAVALSMPQTTTPPAGR